MDKDLTGLQDWKPTDEEPEILPPETIEPEPLAPLEAPLFQETPVTVEPQTSVIPTEGSHNLWALGPFDGTLQDKILSFSEKHALDFNPDTLKLQFESGQILLPRISEYTAILLARILKDHVLDLRVSLTPLDGLHVPQKTPQAFPTLSTSPLPLTPCPFHEEAPPENVALQRLFTGCLLLPEQTESTAKVDGLLASLKEQLQRQAGHLGAIGLYNFKIEQTYLPHAGLYRLTASADAMLNSLDKDGLSPSH